MAITAQVTTIFYINNGWNYQPPPMQSENSPCKVLTFQLRFKTCIDMQYEAVLGHL